MRHLDPSLLEATLRRGKPIEQFLGSRGGSNTIAWLTVRLGDRGFELYHSEVPDLGDNEHLDLYEFGDDADTQLACISASLEQILACAYDGHGAREDHWVNEFVTQDEYRDFIAAGRPDHWPVGDV